MRYYVKVIRDFNDYGGKEVKDGNKCEQRKKGDLFYCKKDRYLYLKDNGVVELVGIKKQSK